MDGRIGEYHFVSDLDVVADYLTCSEGASWNARN